MQLKGKQIKDSSVEQNKLNVTTESITNISSVTNAEYVNTNSVDRVEAITYSTLNMNMVANNATVGDKACPTPIIEFSISNIQVKVNNISVTVGATADCYFSPDAGTTIRIGGLAQKGDYLYWNSSRFDLDNTDEIDFIYITAKETVELEAGSTQVIDPYYPALNVKYTGADDTSMTLTIDGVDFIVGNVSGDFVWDIGGANETTITNIGESILQDVNGEDYTIWFDGFGSLLFSVKKGRYIVEKIYLDFGTGFLNNFEETPDGISIPEEVTVFIIDSNNKYMVGGLFKKYNNIISRGIVRLNQDGSIDNTFGQGSGFLELDDLNFILEDSNNKYMVGGDFIGYNDYNEPIESNIVRLNQDGSVDDTFSRDIVDTITYRTLNCIIEDDGKYVMCGSFIKHNGAYASMIIRLNQDGSVDNTFIQGSGFNNTIYSIILDNNNKYVMCGNYSEYNGTDVNGIIRLNQDGSVDSTFDIGSGFSSKGIEHIIIDNNNKYMVVGNFSEYNGTNVNNIIRLNQDGSVDNTFIQGSGFNNTVSFINEINGKYIVGFSSPSNLTYNGIPINSVIRLNQDGSVDDTFDIGTGFLYETNNGDFINDVILNNCIQSGDNIIIYGEFTRYNDKYAFGAVEIDQNGNDVTLRSQPSPTFNIRMTLVGNLGDFTSGVHILEPTYNAVLPFVNFETWRFVDSNIYMKLFADYTTSTTTTTTTTTSTYTYTYTNTNTNTNTFINYLDNLDLKAYENSINTVGYKNSVNIPNKVNNKYLSDDVAFFKTYNLGNGTTMTLERINL